MLMPMPPGEKRNFTLAIRHGVRAIMVCNGGIGPDPHPLIDLAIVDDGPDAADIWIAERARTGDIVVTNDIPLAARCPQKMRRMSSAQMAAWS